jgi:hypothetical protein
MSYDFGAQRVATSALLTFTALLASRSCGIVIAEFSGHAVALRSSPTVFGNVGRQGPSRPASYLASHRELPGALRCFLVCSAWELPLFGHCLLTSENSLQLLNAVCETEFWRGEAVRRLACVLLRVVDGAIDLFAARNAPLRARRIGWGYRRRRGPQDSCCEWRRGTKLPQR